MWRSIGSINSPDNKSNKSREENYEPFAQASRLRLNESQLSGDNSPQFMHQYFSKKRSPEALPQRSHSQKNIDTLPFCTSPSSMKDLNIHDNKSKFVIPSPKQKQQPSIITLEQQLNNDSIENEHQLIPQKTIEPVNKQNQEVLQKLAAIKQDQNKLKKTVEKELILLKKYMREMEKEMTARINKAEGEAQKDKEKKDGVNPEVLGRIRQESSRFNQRIKQIQNRKEQIREKYKQKQK